MAIERKLHNRIKDVRTECGLTQAALAARLGVSRKTINTVENGVFIPSTTLALAMAEALDVPVEALFQLTPDTPATPS